MYVRDVHIKNVKLLRDAKISFLRGDEPRMWTVLVGENGMCKTTILQAIALAASGRDRANQLADVPSLIDRRTSKIEATIQARFSFRGLGHPIRVYPQFLGVALPAPWLNSEIRIRPDSFVVDSSSYYRDAQSSAERNRVLNAHIVLKGQLLASRFGDMFDDPLISARGGNLSDWFVAGYGIDRKLPEPLNSPKMTDPAFQRMAPLFGKGPILATSFAELFDSEDQVRDYTIQLTRALIENPTILPKITDLELRVQNPTIRAKQLVLGDRFGFNIGDDSVQVPATWLSQGYQATIAWIADLVGQMFWDARKAITLEEMEGLVLIDEIDIHLHPTWQVNLIQALKRTFPHVQFVVTTHSPMILPGLERDEILRVRQDETGSVVVEPVDQSPAVMTGSELYEAFFGIEGLYPRDLGDALRRYGYLTSDPYRSDEEQAEMEQIAEKLRAAKLLPDWEPVARETA